MAQWHVVELTQTGLRLVVHFIVPTTKNAAGTALSAAALAVGSTGKAASAFADESELVDLASGKIAEVELLAGIDGAIPLLDQREAIQKQVKEQWQKDLAFTGYSEGTVV